MMIYRSPDLTARMDYFKSKFPSLKDTIAYYCQDPSTDSEARLKIGMYDTEHNIIILYDHPALDDKMINILAHEVAHALCWINGRCRGHEKIWVNYCHLIYQKTGVMPTHVKECEDESMCATLALSVTSADILKAYRANKHNPCNPNIQPADDDTMIYIKRHKSRIRFWMLNFSNFLIERAVHHDDSKMKEPEISMWRNMDKEPRHPYSEDPNSPYQRKLKKYYPVFEEHWRNNRHHLEYYKYNTEDFGLDLIDLVELICDQLLGYKYEVGYDKAMKECRRLESKYPEIFGDNGIRVIALMENTIRNYFVSFASGRPECQLSDLPMQGLSIDITV